MIKDYIIKQTLGKGTYGIVYKVQKLNTNSIYVIKQIPLSGLSEKERNEVEQEAKILHSINSNYVVKYYDSFKENENLNIVMEYCDGGDLNDFLIEKKKLGQPLEEPFIWKIFIKITIGLADIHKLKILHRDLKTLNIFLKQNFDIKIGDLGVAKVLSKNNFARTVIGTPYYLSPEICEEKPYNDKSDVWALGCILYELCTFKHPFEARSQGALILKILNNKPEPINNTFSKELNNIIYMLLDKNYDKRPSCIEILKNNMVISKIKSLGLSELLTDLDNISNDQSNIKISNPINIRKKYYNKKDINNEKEYIINNANNGKPDIKNNKKKQLSAINLLEQINNNKLNFNNLNQYMMQNKKNNISKINIIRIGDSNNKKPSFISANNQNKNSSVEYNNFFINDSNIKKINNKKDIISKQYNKIYKQERSDIVNKKIGKIQPVKIIFKKSNEVPKINNFIESKKQNIINDNNKKKNEEAKTNNNDSKYIKKIKINNSNKLISNYKLKEKENNNSNKVPIKIKQITDKSIKFNNQNIDEEVSKNKTEVNIGSNPIKNNINSNFKNGNSLQINKNIKITKIINSNKDKNNKHNLISFLPKNDLEFNIGEKRKYSTPSNNDNKIFNEKIAANFQIINNDNFQRDDKDKNDEKIFIANEFEDSDEEITGKMKRSESCFNPRINKEKNIIDSDNDNNSYDDDEEENVKEIKENQFQNNIKNINGKQIENHKNIISNEIQNLKEKVQNSKDEMLQLIGDKDYKYIMDLYNIGIKDQNKIDDIYQNIEDFVEKNYSKEQKEKFNNCYLLLVSLDCQLAKKAEEINNINIFV